MKKERQTPNLITEGQDLSNGGDAPLKAAENALHAEDTGRHSQEPCTTEAPPESPMPLSDDDIILDVSSSPAPRTRNRKPPTVPNAAVVRLKRRIADVSQRHGSPPSSVDQVTPRKGRREESFVLFSAATLEKVRGDFSTRHYADDETVQDALMDIRHLSRSSDSIPPTPNDKDIHEVLSLPKVSTPPVSPLVSRRGWLSIVGIAVVAVAGALIGAFIVSATIDDRDTDREIIEKSGRMAMLQQQYNDLLSMISSAKLDSVATLRQQLNEAREELEYLKSERRTAETERQRTSEEVSATAPPVEVPSDKTTSRRTVVPPKQTKARDDLDDLLGGPAASKPPPKPMAGDIESIVSDLSLAAQTPPPGRSLTREDVRQGIRPVLAKIKRCGNGTPGTVTIAVTISKDGSVTKASAVGEFAEKPIGYCAARVMQNARFPQSESGATIRYPVSL